MTTQKHSNLKIGITGKRDIVSNILVREEIKKTISAILKKEKTKSFVAYSAMAKGADTIFADVVNKEFNQKIIIVLPFDSIEYEKDFTEYEDLSEYENWIRTIGVSETITKDTPKNQDERNEAYFSVGKFIVDTCDYMIVVWDGLKPAGKGGTAEILGYASQSSNIKGIEIIKIESSKKDEIDDATNTLLNNADKKAIRLKKKYEIIWITSIILAWLTAISFSATLSFHFSTPIKLLFSALELVFIVIVFILIKITKKQELHPKLLKERLKTEKLRLLVAYYHADLPITISEITQKDDEKLASVAEKVNAASNKSYQSKWYKYFTIKNLIEGQKKYHHNLSENVIGNIPVQLKKIKLIIYLTWLLILISHFFTLLFDVTNCSIPILTDYPYPDDISWFFAIGLPATYATIEGFMKFKDWENFKDQSSTMETILNSELKHLIECKLANDEFLQILNRVSLAMLADNDKWFSILSTKETPHPIL